MLVLKQLYEMSQSEIDKVDKTGLVDIHEVKIDANLPPEQRMINYLEQIKNPYCFLCEDSTVCVKFESEGNDLKGKLKNFFISLKKI